MGGEPQELRIVLDRYQYLAASIADAMVAINAAPDDAAESSKRLLLVSVIQLPNEQRHRWQREAVAVQRDMRFQVCAFDSIKCLPGEVHHVMVAVRQQRGSVLPTRRHVEVWGTDTNTCRMLVELTTLTAADDGGGLLVAVQWRGCHFRTVRWHDCLCVAAGKLTKGKEMISEEEENERKLNSGFALSITTSIDDPHQEYLSMQQPC